MCRCPIYRTIYQDATAGQRPLHTAAAAAAASAAAGGVLVANGVERTGPPGRTHQDAPAR